MNKFKIIVMLLLSIFLLAACGKTDEVLSNSFDCKLNEEYSIDLNNDKEKETIIIDKNSDSLDLIVNGENYSLEMMDFALVDINYRVIDIDEKDDYLEIAIKEAYPPMHDRVLFFRYLGNEIEYLGDVLISSLYETGEDMMIAGDGLVKVNGFSAIMEEGYFETIYQSVEDGTLHKEIPDFIEYSKSIESEVYKSIKAYENKVVDSEYIEIGIGEKITILGETDNWLKIKWNDDIYWINGEELTHYDPKYPDVKFEFDGIRFWS